MIADIYKNIVAAIMTTQPIALTSGLIAAATGTAAE